LLLFELLGQNHLLGKACLAEIVLCLQVAKVLQGMLLVVTLLTCTGFDVFVAFVLLELVHRLALILVSWGNLRHVVYSHIFIKEFYLGDMNLLRLLGWLGSLDLERSLLV
jgi:hypothetical protein